HGDGGVIDLGKVAHRKGAVGDDAEQRDTGHQQAGGNGTPDEILGDVHAQPLTENPLILRRTLAPFFTAPATAPSAAFMLTARSRSTFFTGRRRGHCLRSCGRRLIRRGPSASAAGTASAALAD